MLTKYWYSFFHVTLKNYQLLIFKQSFLILFKNIFLKILMYLKKLDFIILINDLMLGKLHDIVK